MSTQSGTHRDQHDLAPGDEQAEGGIATGVLGYLIGLVLALGLTACSYYVAGSDLIWKPGISTGLIVLAIAQMGVHLVFFLHITTAPDSTNNVLALARKKLPGEEVSRTLRVRCNPRPSKMPPENAAAIATAGILMSLFATSLAFRCDTSAGKDQTNALPKAHTDERASPPSAASAPNPSTPPNPSPA